jgi:hypothetical protein
VGSSYIGVIDAKKTNLGPKIIEHIEASWRPNNSSSSHTMVFNKQPVLVVAAFTLALLLISCGT